MKLLLKTATEVSNTQTKHSSQLDIYVDDTTVNLQLHVTLAIMQPRSMTSINLLLHVSHPAGTLMLGDSVDKCIIFIQHLNDKILVFRFRVKV